MALAVLLGSGVHAHDSWLQLAPPDGAPGTRLELGVGPHYPVSDFGIAAASVLRPGCVQADDGRDRPLRPVQETPGFLVLRTSADASRGLACWAELDAWEVELPPELVPLYFEEIRPGAAAKERWEAMRTQRAGWRESFRKFLRLESAAPAGAAEVPAALRRPRGLAFEIVPVGVQALQAGALATFQLLLDGRPLAGQWVEIVGEGGARREWHLSDASGQVRQALQAPGQWLVRATWLEAPAPAAALWHSRFATLVVHAR